MLKGELYTTIYAEFLNPWLRRLYVNSTQQLIVRF